MNQDLAQKLIARSGDCLTAPGCCDAFLGHPNPTGRIPPAVELGFVIEHRFAFAYWIKCKQKLQKQSRYKIPERHFHPPDLVTWDWHDDCRFSIPPQTKELELLDQNNIGELALYCWTSLSPSNDTHILPAIWLNAIGNVYIVQKQRSDYECRERSREYLDRLGNTHNIYYFRTHKEMASCLEKNKTEYGVIWDIDLDFLVDKNCGTSDVSLLSKRSINAMLSYKKPWMPLILEDLKAITIALEPSFTGGLTNSLELYKIWENALFDRSVFDIDTRWKHKLYAE